MKLDSCHTPDIIFRDEPSYSFNSTDNKTLYATEVLIGDETKPNTIYGIEIDGSPRLVIGTNSGVTSISKHTYLLKDHLLLFAIGCHICQYDLCKSELTWNLQIDYATCFGIHYSATKDAYISHGELSISRFDLEGNIIWQSTGADIFSEGFALQDSFIEAVDFCNNKYRFDYQTGGAL